MRLLNIQGLGIRLVGYHIGDQYSNAANWLKGLGLPADTPVHWVNAPNKNNSASMLHCGIEVIQQDRKERGSECRSTKPLSFESVPAKVTNVVAEFEICIKNNREFIPNFGERWRQG